jgi:hypothetical protein
MTQESAGDGRHISVTVRLTDAEAAEIDGLRGKVGRGPWIRGAALASARPQPKQGGKCKHENLRLVKGVCPDCGLYAVRK